MILLYITDPEFALLIMEVVYYAHLQVSFPPGQSN